MKLSCALVLCLGLALGAESAPAFPFAGSLPVTDAYPEDPALARVIDPLRAELNLTFGVVVVRCPGGLHRHTGAGENPLGYWMADAMRARAEGVTGAPVKLGFTNSGGIRANIRPGSVRVGDLAEVMPFENELVVVELTGAEVLKLVREGFMHRTREPMSGIQVRVGGTPGQPELLITWKDGHAIDPGEVVKVATSDYLLATLPLFKHARHPFTTGLTLRQVLVDACTALDREGKVLAPPPPGRVLVTDEELQLLKHHS